MPWFKSYSGGGRRIREDEPKSVRAAHQPIILGKGRKFAGIILAVDPLLIHEINRLLMRRAMLAIARKGHPPPGFAKRVVVFRKVKEKGVKLVCRRTVARFDQESFPQVGLHRVHHALINFINILRQVLRSYRLAAAVLFDPLILDPFKSRAVCPGP